MLAVDENLCSVGSCCLEEDMAMVVLHSDRLLRLDMVMERVERLVWGGGVRMEVLCDRVPRKPVLMGLLLGDLLKEGIPSV